MDCLPGFPIERSGFEPSPESLRCILGRDTLISQCFSLRKGINWSGKLLGRLDKMLRSNLLSTHEDGFQSRASYDALSQLITLEATFLKLYLVLL